ncbi:MAG: glycosyltransferase family 2 protein [Salinivirgaceae bacterium]|jgi:glycosyltransferase involved in cell wall biosynthesis
MGNNSGDLISVIVPVYKVEKYLKRCIESILSQSYQNFELILIDDGSPDNCPQICDSYATKYSNIKVIHQNNSGQSIARNVGIELAKGKYLTFIDSDDFVHKFFLEQLINNLSNNDSRISMCSYQNIYDSFDINEFSIERNYGTLNIINDEEAMDILLTEQTLCAPWGKLYEKSLFSKVKFPEGKIYEDMLVMPLIFKDAKKIVLSNQTFYFYNQEGTSTTRSQFSYNKLGMVVATKFWHEFIKSNYPKLEEKAHIHYFSTLLSTCIYLVKQTDDYGKSIYAEYRKKVLQDYKLIMTSNFTKRNDKIKVILMKLGLFRILISIFTRLNKLRIN